MYYLNMKLKTFLKTFVKIILPLALGVLLIWYIYHKMDLTAIWEVVKSDVRYDILIFSLIFGLLANITRGYRWGLLIRSIGEKVQTKNVVYAVLGNYAVNLVLPRMGEVWRCGIITRYEKIPFTKLFGTLLIDRLSDTIMVGSITFLIFVFNIDFFLNFFSANPAILTGFENFIHSIWMYTGLLLFAVIIWAVFKYLGHLSLVAKAKRLLLDIWEGVKSIWYLDKKWLFIVQTFIIWGGYFLYFYTTFYAFDFTRHLGVGVGLIAFTMSSIAVAVPVQGGFGPWHFMVIATLVCFGVDKTDAAAFALVVHTVQTLWMVICGLFGIVALPIINKNEKSKN